jgi:hypothetical protein
MKHVLRTARSAAWSSVLAAAVLLASSAAAAESPRLTSVPLAPAWTLGHSFVAALNGYDRQALEHFLIEHLSSAALRQQTAPDRARDLLRARRQMGAVEIIEVSGVPHALVFNVRNGSRTAAAEIVIVIEASDSGLADEIVLIPNSI